MTKLASDQPFGDAIANDLDFGVAISYVGVCGQQSDSVWGVRRMWSSAMATLCEAESAKSEAIERWPDAAVRVHHPNGFNDDVWGVEITLPAGTALEGLPAGIRGVSVVFRTS